MITSWHFPIDPVAICFLANERAGCAGGEAWRLMSQKEIAERAIGKCTNKLEKN